MMMGTLTCGDFDGCPRPFKKTFARETLWHSILPVTEVRVYIYIHRFLAGKQRKRFDDEVRHLSLEPWSTAGIFFVRALQMNVGCAPFSV